MKKRYFNKAQKTEVIPGIHFTIKDGKINNPNVVELPSNHVFFSQIPENFTMEFNAEGLPISHKKAPLQILADFAWTKVKAMRATKMEDVLEHAGELYQIDRYSRENMEDAIAEMSGTDRIDWRTAENTDVSLSAVQLQNILTKYRQRKHVLSKASWMVEAIILNSANPEELELDTLYDEKITEVLNEGR